MRTNSLRDELDIGGGPDRPGRAGIGFGVDFAVSTILNLQELHKVLEPTIGVALLVLGSGSIQVRTFLGGMIQAQGQRRPGAANMRNVAIDLIYDALE
ncbi:MAG: hypothetical protein CM1200mP40_13690 [Gammaproteobacteria bacterium]|nr:MAG: hypothetical protein CM1200mP40_13690 [Gammaproteobacteria bacterium]